MSIKTKKFHQFVVLEQGPVNTAIIDLLKGNVFQVENNMIKKFNNGNFGNLSDFIKSLENEDLIIEIDDERWIPENYSDNDNYHEEQYFEIEIEEGADLKLIKEKINPINISQIVFYGKCKSLRFWPGVKVVNKKKDFNQCIQRSEIEGEFEKINEEVYKFNKKYNSCWGNKFAVKKNGNISPCIYSNIIVCNLNNVDFHTVLEKITKYSLFNKDKVEICKNCELRYICFDCREVAKSDSNNLNAKNPRCKYDPYKGSWFE